MNNTTDPKPLAGDALSIFLLSLVWPAHLILSVDSLLNVLIAVFLLYIFDKWKVYEGNLWFMLRGHLVTEILVNLLIGSGSVYHAINYVLGRSEMVSTVACHHVFGMASSLLCQSGWFTIFIACDRYVAIVTPMKYEGR